MVDYVNDPYWSKYWNLANARGTDVRYEEALARGDMQTARQYETYWAPQGGGWYADAGGWNLGNKTFSPEEIDRMEGDSHFQFRGQAVAASAAAPITPQAGIPKPSFDPKIESNQLYGKPMVLFSGGYARIGAGPAPIVGPYINGDIVEFVVSFGVPANPEGERKLYKIWLDQELAWSSVAGGTLPGDGTFASTPFDFVFRPGTLTQMPISLEYEKYPGDENAYRPMMILEIRNLPWQRFMDLTGKPVPYVAAEIGDVTDGAIPQDGINLGLAIERVAWSPWVGNTPDNFEAVNITDVIGAVLIKDNFNIIQLCQNITGEYKNIDLLVSDKIRIKDRGGNVTPDFVLNRDSIIGGDDALSVARASATAQRREHELYTIDPDQDYTGVPSLAKIPRDPLVISAAAGKDSATLPLVIDASTRQALATFSLYYLENSRRKLSFKILALGYQIEPGDLFALTDIANGFDNEVFKTTQTTHGANWVVDIEGEAILRCLIYREPYAGYVLVCGSETGVEKWTYSAPGLLLCGAFIADIGQMDDTPMGDPSEGVRAMGPPSGVGNRTVIGAWDPLPGNTIPFEPGGG